MIKLPRIPDHLNFQWPYLPHQLRARDIEVAKAVLEAAATWIESQRNDIPATGKEFAAAIRALEISHD